MALQELSDFCGYPRLREHSLQFVNGLHLERGTRPFHIAGGQALLNAKLPLNTFAADLSPILVRYFSSAGAAAQREIAERAYVSSEETTEYDRILEAMLKERVSPRRDKPVQALRPSRSREPLLTKAIQDFQDGEHENGQLQIIQGAVGSGKSLFARRYHDLLEPPDLRSQTHWCFIDFNGSPPSLMGSERWLCEKLIDSFERENPDFDLYSVDSLRRIFSRNIQKRRGTYEIRAKISEEEESRARGRLGGVAGRSGGTNRWACQIYLRNAANHGGRPGQRG